MLWLINSFLFADLNEHHLLTAPFQQNFGFPQNRYSIPVFCENCRAEVECTTSLLASSTSLPLEKHDFRPNIDIRNSQYSTFDIVKEEFLKNPFSLLHL